MPLVLVDDGGVYAAYENLSPEGERRWVVNAQDHYLSVGTPVGPTYSTLWYVPFDKAAPCSVATCGECGQRKFIVDDDFLCRKCREGSE